MCVPVAMASDAMADLPDKACCKRVHPIFLSHRMAVPRVGDRLLDTGARMFSQDDYQWMSRALELAARPLHHGSQPLRRRRAGEGRRGGGGGLAQAGR